MSLELSNKELNLLEGMIAQQENHILRCQSLQNRRMAIRQAKWDQERVDVLTKIILSVTGPGV